MATKKISTGKSAPKKTIMTKIARKVGFLAGELVAGKDQLVEMAGGAIESVKATIQPEASATKKKVVKKKALAIAKKVVAKPVAAAVKKSKAAVASKKSAVVKTVKKVAKKVASKK